MLKNVRKCKNEKITFYYKKQLQFTYTKIIIFFFK